MAKKEDYLAWFKRAESNLKLAKAGNVSGVACEDLCFEAQQSAEKALKALLIYFGDEFPKVHSFVVLLERLQRYVNIPKDIQDVLELSDYAIQTRYPGEYYPVQKKEFERAIHIAQGTLNWVKKVIKENRK